MPGPELTRSDAGTVPRGLVLLLHGGQEHSLAPVGDRSASWRRTRWMMGQIEGRAHAAGLSLWLLRYTRRGWNAEVSALPSPVPDARWALERARRELGRVPVVLLGHSMGARAAVAVADDPLVAGVVALAPWLPPGEPVAPLAGRHFAAAHGHADRITSLPQTVAFLRRAEPVAASVEMVDMGPVGHYMLRRIPRWNAFAIERARAFLSA